MPALVSSPDPGPAPSSPRGAAFSHIGAEFPPCQRTQMLHAVLPQVSMPTAAWLTSMKSYTVYGSPTSPQALHKPEFNLYLCGAYLLSLAKTPAPSEAGTPRAPRSAIPAACTPERQHWQHEDLQAASPADANNDGDAQAVLHHLHHFQRQDAEQHAQRGQLQEQLQYQDHACVEDDGGADGGMGQRYAPCQSREEFAVRAYHYGEVQTGANLKEVWGMVQDAGGAPRGYI
jgi:hypothetical protein